MDTRKGHGLTEEVLQQHNGQCTEEVLQQHNDQMWCNAMLRRGGFLQQGSSAAIQPCQQGGNKQSTMGVGGRQHGTHPAPNQ